MKSGEKPGFFSRHIVNKEKHNETYRCNGNIGNHLGRSRTDRPFRCDPLYAVGLQFVALILFSTARQIWNGDPRGWLFMVSIAVIFLIINIISLISGTPWEYLSAQITLSVLALILGLLPSTKREFGQAT